MSGKLLQFFQDGRHDISVQWPVDDIDAELPASRKHRIDIGQERIAALRQGIFRCCRLAATVAAPYIAPCVKIPEAAGFQTILADPR